MGTGWYTFSEAEISYMLYHYDHKWTSVNGIAGLMVLNSEKVTPSKIADAYDPNTWQHLEAEGSVFLPTAGLREYDYDIESNIVISDVGEIGYYWTSSYDMEDEDTDYAYQLKVEEGLGTNGLDGYQTSLTWRSQGLSVRLVRLVE